MVKKILRYTRNSVLFLIVFVLLYLGLAWLLSRIPVRAEKNTQPDISIYLKSNGVHTDLVMPVKTTVYD